MIFAWMGLAAFLIITIGIIWHIWHPSQLNPIDPHQRSRKLLSSYLSPSQQLQLVKGHYFDILGSDGHHYRIRYKNMYNVHDLTDQLILCSYPRGNLPIYDWMLGQKLLIENDALAFRQNAGMRREVRRELRYR